MLNLIICQGIKNVLKWYLSEVNSLVSNNVLAFSDFQVIISIFLLSLVKRNERNFENAVINIYNFDVLNSLVSHALSELHLSSKFIFIVEVGFHLLQ